MVRTLYWQRNVNITLRSPGLQECSLDIQLSEVPLAGRGSRQQLVHTVHSTDGNVATKIAAASLFPCGAIRAFSVKGHCLPTQFCKVLVHGTR